jgi:trehalose 6-phosphate synthase/phosphatase
MQELQAEVAATVERLNATYGVTEGAADDKDDEIGHGKVVVLLHRSTTLAERVALMSVADCAVVTATRDGMNLLPYEYITCRQGPVDVAKGTGELHLPAPRRSSLIMSEFVGCSSSLSGAFRVNPWSVDDVADAMYRAAMLPIADAEARHEKHWKYISEHTVGYWCGAFPTPNPASLFAHTRLTLYFSQSGRVPTSRSFSEPPSSREARGVTGWVSG